jgi:hypothetical protein
VITRRFAGTLILLGALSVPLIAAPHAADPAQPAEATAAEVLCGEVLAVDLFNQTFLVMEGSKVVETVPFSRWTDFVTRATDRQGRRHLQALDPTDVRIGDHLCISLDPSGATADRIEVLPARRATEIARACAK